MITDILHLRDIGEQLRYQFNSLYESTEYLPHFNAVSIGLEFGGYTQATFRSSLHEL